MYSQDKFLELVEKACKSARGRSATFGSLADALGVKRGTFYKYTRGARKPPEWLCRSLEDIIGGKGVALVEVAGSKPARGPSPICHQLLGKRT